MRALAAAVALLAACHGGGARHHQAPPPARGSGSASAKASLVPDLPPSPDPRQELDGLDERIKRTAGDPREDGLEIALLLERASIAGDLADYQEALARSEAWVKRAPADVHAWHARVQTLSRVHRFADARATLEKLKPLVKDPTVWQELEATIDEATGHFERSQPLRDQFAKVYPNTVHFVMQAYGLGSQGRIDEALAIMPKAVASLHDNSPELFAWVLFQWGRLYELKGEPAAARDFYEAARARLPTLEATVHLAQAMIATGDTAGAKALVEAALAEHRQPDLLGLAVQLGHPELAAEAKAAWEKYVAALPLAFSDHAARFYLVPGPDHDPARALQLAKLNLANRDTREARALVVEAALAAKDVKAACTAAEPLVDPASQGQPGSLHPGPVGLRSERFTAWKALSACGRKAEADRLARELGITH